MLILDLSLNLVDILTLEDLMNLNALKIYYKYIKATVPSYFYSFRIVTQG